jgi:hypothetical protein
VALAVAVRAGEDSDAAGWVGAHFGRLVEAGAGTKLARHHRGCHGAGLDIGADADAAQLAAVVRLPPPPLEVGVIGRLHRHVECLEVVATVIGERNRRRVGIGVVGDEVAPPQRYRVERHLARGTVDEALHHIAGLWPPSPAIGVDRRGVGENALDLDIDRGGRVIAGEQGAVAPSRDRRGEAAEIGAEIGQRGDPHGKEFAVLIESKLGFSEMVARLVVGQKDLAAFGGPFDGATELTREPEHERLLGVERALGAEAAAPAGHD